MQRELCQDLGITSGQLQPSAPYTYLIVHIPSGKKYYGVRYAQGCSPSDLWDTYFTSSKAVKKLIDKDGRDSFKLKIRKVFTNIDEAIKWEGRFLKKVKARQREDFLNKHNNDGLVSLKGDANPMKNTTVVARWKESFQENKLNKNKKLSESHKQAISNSLRGRIRSNEERSAISKGLKGKKHSDEFKRKCKERQTGVVPSEETRIKKCLAIKGRKKYTDGFIVKTFFPGSQPTGWNLLKK